MPVYTVLIFFGVTAPYLKENIFYVLLLQTIILTIFVPISLYYLLLAMKMVDSIMIADKNQRKIPLLAHAFLLFVFIKKSLIARFFPELYYFFCGSMASTLIALVFIYLNKKASLHMIGISALTFFTMGLSIHFHINLIFSIALLIFSNGLIASSRLAMKAHTYEELLLGAIAGIIPQVVAGYFWI